ncbi:hypothetical protein FA13DRAFT_1737070 [Coprinellus micaceus]|uniref:Uncharacterized protein n=1 Tax=Coprinellus micaceus TaxID=71717 RepID=A0A4Y7SZ05_COPMI|nr:hypothetical protein FA13DRAFT_1737070 [Coprinellus micaceus]
MSPAPSSKQKCLTYPEAARAFADANLREDLTDACARLGQGLAVLMEKFEAIAKEVHSIDMQRLAAPLKPRWDTLSKDYGTLLWQYRSNAGYISGRLKLLSDSVLPVAARNTSARSRRSYQETVQILQSFMTISAEHAATTRSLVERTVALVQHMVAFHTEISKMVTRRQSCAGRQEAYDLATKLSELEGSVRQLCSLNSDLPRSDVTHVSVSAFRIITSCGPKPTRSKTLQRRNVMTEDLHKISQAYSDLELKRSEFAHAQYTAQIRTQQNDCMAITQTRIASLCSDTMLALESTFGFSQSIWARLKTDCCDIFQWLNAATPTDPPPVLSEYHECGPALYATLAIALDSCVGNIDPTKFKAIASC